MNIRIPRSPFATLAAVLVLTAYGFAAQAAEDTADEQFLNAAAKGSAAEVAIGQMAESQAESPQVREFAAKLVKDHAQALAAARQTAQQAGVPVNIRMTPEQERLAESLSQKHGRSFDEAYIKAMVDKHQQTVATFEKHLQQGSGETAAFAERQLPLLRGHLQEARAIASEL